MTTPPARFTQSGRPEGGPLSHAPTSRVGRIRQSPIGAAQGRRAYMRDRTLSPGPDVFSGGMSENTGSFFTGLLTGEGTEMRLHSQVMPDAHDRAPAAQPTFDHLVVTKNEELLPLCGHWRQSRVLARANDFHSPAGGHSRCARYPRANRSRVPRGQSEVVCDYTARSVGGGRQLQGVGSSLRAQNAATPTTDVAPAAADEVSAQFAAHAQMPQAVARRPQPVTRCSSTPWASARGICGDRGGQRRPRPEKG